MVVCVLELTDALSLKAVLAANGIVASLHSNVCIYGLSPPLDLIEISPLQDVPTVNGTVGSTYSNAYLNATAASQKFYLPPKPDTLSGVPAAPCLAALAPRDQSTYSQHKVVR